MILSILICTIEGREAQFEKLLFELSRQRSVYGRFNDVEILHWKDNKQMTVGTKRQKLLEQATGDYVVFVDDDDEVSPFYIIRILTAIDQQKPDCIGFKIRCIFDGGIPKTAVGSNRFSAWADNVEGYDYVRTIYHKNPIRRDIALKIGYMDMRYAEDHDYSKRLKASGLLKTEVFLDEYLYIYNYSSKIPHNQKYGIRK